MSKESARAIKQFNDKSFGLKSPRFIVDSTHPSPTDTVFNVLYCDANVTGFSCTDLDLMDGSASYDTTKLVGWIWYGNFRNISCSSGKIVCTINSVE